MLKILRVSDDSRSIILHTMTGEVYTSPSKLKVSYCRLKLEHQYDASGNMLPGRCSRICEHGIMAATNSFNVKFPILIEGGG